MSLLIYECHEQGYRKKNRAPTSTCSVSGLVANILSSTISSACIDRLVFLHKKKPPHTGRRNVDKCWLLRRDHPVGSRAVPQAALPLRHARSLSSGMRFTFVMTGSVMIEAACWAGQHFSEIQRRCYMSNANARLIPPVLFRPYSSFSPHSDRWHGKAYKRRFVLADCSLVDWKSVQFGDGFESSAKYSISQGRHTRLGHSCCGRSCHRR